MTKSYQPLLSDDFLKSVFAKDFAEFSGSDTEKALMERLTNWRDKAFQTETQAEAAFLNVFFEDTWAYTQSGKTGDGQGFTCHPKFPVAGAGAAGGTGEADLALGFFDHPKVPATPQVLCEFKDVRSNLDAPQKRKGNTRSPVKQCADYLREAAKPLFGNEAVQPTWGIVTDMNEFRLYWRNNMPAQYQKFTITAKTGDDTVSLLDNSEAASFQRFLFLTLFSHNYLLTEAGRSPLLQLLHKQWVQEKEIENAFYREYRAYRERLITIITEANPNFPGTKGHLVRLAQKLIDRCIFVLFCEDMGEALSFPPNALRDYLAELSRMASFDPDGHDAWNKLKELFHAMNEGKKFLSQPINRFNGGLFADDPTLESLAIPNKAFCAAMQGENEETLLSSPETLLYLSGKYNFGASGNSGHAITLYILGRIFEQSITELEVLEAEAEGRPSLTKVTQRKRTGVYYTPEAIVEHIVRETLTPRLDALRAECGWDIEIEGDDKLVAKQIALSPSKRSAAFTRHIEGVHKFRDELDRFTVCDPACGSGAFLIHTLEFLLRERRRVLNELARVTGGKGATLFEFKPDDEIRSILSKNIYGVDINPASVEIAQLALWLHTAKSDQPLSNLASNIKCGNSLIDSEFYTWRQDLLSWGQEKKETVNAFDWETAFPKVFDDSQSNGAGFDCVVGNPPYVKLQHFRKVYPEMAEFLVEAEGAAGQPLYQSTQTGNFDLFLPFIEKGITLLNEHGSLGYIAPSLWRYNEYGEGLRSYLHKGCYLDRWIDFGSYQVFEEAITYTALQFYSKTAHDRVRFVLAPDGEIAKTPDWDDPNWYVTYQELPDRDPWIFVPRHERAILQKLNANHPRLGDSSVTSEIFQGLITSADYIYHLDRVGPGRYRHYPKKKDSDSSKPHPVDIHIEDAIMHPLVSGEEANRYERPHTDTYILFPYEVESESVRLLSQKEMASSFPNAWKYLRSYEKQLRARESGAFDDDNWYRFGRHQNIDKQETRKLIVAQTVRNMAVCPDHDGEFYVNNVRVNGIIPAEPNDYWYLLGILNSRVANWVFQRIAKPKGGGYFEANRQFIAPLPIPTADADQHQAVEELAKELTDLYSRRRDTIESMERRFSACEEDIRPPSWLWPSIRDAKHWKTQAPCTLSARQKTAWGKEMFSQLLEERFEDLRSFMRIDGHIEPEFTEGELILNIDGTPAIRDVFMSQEAGRLALLSWQSVARSTTITEKLSPPELVKKLLSIHTTANTALTEQLETLQAELQQIEAAITVAESSLNSLAYGLYQLTSEQIRVVEAS